MSLQDIGSTRDPEGIGGPWWLALRERKRQEMEQKIARIPWWRWWKRLRERKRQEHLLDLAERRHLVQAQRRLESGRTTSEPVAS